MDDGESFFEKFAYRLVEKHIAGKTMASVIARALEFNERNILASVHFMSETPDNRAKVGYITNTYMQLARQMGRFGVKGAMHVPIEQLGSAISTEAAMESIEKINSTCEHYKTFCWYEVCNNEGDMKIAYKLLESEGYGIAFSDYTLLSFFLKRRSKTKHVKIVLNDEKNIKDFLSESKDVSKSAINGIISNARSILFASSNDNVIDRIARIPKAQKKVVFEYEFGESEKRIGKMMKKGFGASVFMPFGKDWVKYAIKKDPEGHMRSFATELIKPKETK